MSIPLVDIWRRINSSELHPWVLFGRGTVVILKQPKADLGRQAVELMKEWGPVTAGTPAGDFDVIKLLEDSGWLVTCHHPDILTYVGPEEVEGSNNSEVFIGLTGRSKRDQDARELNILHIEYDTD
jgi:hypothetical protein